MEEEPRWIIKPRNYELDSFKYQSKLNPISKDQDPLKVDISVLTNTKKKKKYYKMGNLMFSKVTSNPLESKNQISTNKKEEKKNEKKPEILPYGAKKIEDYKHLQYSLIVNQNFNVADKIEDNWTCLKKNLMDLFGNNFNVEIKSLYSFDITDEQDKNYKIEKGRQRIEELESDKKDFDVVTVGEFVSKMEITKKEMLQKWDKEDKVGTLRIIIQATKILNDVSTPKFYCHKFILISDFLDKFSNLVYERILKLSFGNKNHIDFSNINPSIGSQTAKDVCSNWIMKCCCIRELLPRIYIDISFLGIFKFIMNDQELEQKILTISRMIRGISHPLIAFYVSMYLTKITLMLYPKMKTFLFILLQNLSKFEITESLMKKLKYDNMTIDELKKVLDPCVEWIVYCICKNMNSKDFKVLTQTYDESKNYSILKGMIIHSPSKFIFNEGVLQYIFTLFQIYTNYETTFLCMLLCQKILITDYPIDGKYIAVMWEKIKVCEDKGLFIDCCGLLGEILIKFHNEDVQDKFFEEVFEIFKNTFSSSATSGKSQSEIQNYFAKFEVFLYNILTKITNYSNILNGDNFLFLLENFAQEMKLNICNTIFKQLTTQKEKITDTYLAFSLLKIGKFIHDSIEPLSGEKKKQEVNDILIAFIRKIDFGLDYENYLNLLTEARALYTDFQEVTEVLIKQVQKIAIQTYKLVKGRHNKKTMRFCKICVAYCQITIPGITSIKTQLKLQLVTAQIALMNNLISECDSITRHMISGIQKEILEFLDKNEFNFIENFSKNLLGFLIVVPSNPDDPFQLIRAFYNIFNDEKLNKTSLVLKLKLSIYVSLVKFLHTQLQNKLPYHIFNVESNDEIFTGDEQFISIGNALIGQIISDILDDISEFDGQIQSNDYDSFEFMIGICGECTEMFKYDFEQTNFQVNVRNTMLQLIDKYIDCFAKNNKAYGVSQKVSKYKQYVKDLNDDL
jgi:hypothetical protein